MAGVDEDERSVRDDAAVSSALSVHTLRRAAASEYHTHPEDLRRKSNSNPYLAGAQMMPL